MSTNDVPGAVAANNDQLAMGCWAEHTDGSLLFVESTEGDAVIYSMFDLSKTPIIEYRDAMPLKDFQQTFSWPSGPEKWTWHDKTLFPWDRVIEKFPHGARMSSAQTILTAAERIANRLGLSGTERETSILKQEAENLIQRLQTAIAQLPA